MVHRRPRRVACGLPSLPRPAPSPCLASCTPRKVRRAVWRTHTHSGLPRARGRVGEAASTAATARVRHALFASRHPLRHAHTHTASQLHMAHPAPHTHPPELLHLLPAVRHRRSRPHPSARAIPLGSARCSLVCVRARRVRGGTGARVAAVQQELHTERQPAPAAVHRKNPARRFPPSVRPVCDALSHGPFAAPPSGAAASTRSELRHALHTARARPPGTRTAPAPPRPPVQNARAAPTRELTPNLHTGRFRGHRDPGAEVERRREVRAPLSYARSIASPGASCHPQRAEPLHCTPLAHFVAHSRDASCTNFLSYSSAPGPCLRRYRPHSGPCSRSGLCTCQRGRYMGLTMVPVAGLQRLHLHRRSRPSSSAAQPPH